MGKTTRVLLGAVVAVALTSGAQAAGKAGIGLEWAWVPSLPMSGFDIGLSGQEVTLVWDVSENFTVGVFRGDGQAQASHEYDSLSAPTVTRGITLRYPTTISGIRVLTNLPVLNNMLSAGLEMGALAYGTGVYSYTGDATVDTQFWAAGEPAVNPLDGVTVPLIGITGKIRLIEAKASTVTTALTVAASARIIPFPAKYDLVGEQEIDTAAPQDEIDPIGNNTNVAISVALGLWF